MKNSILKRKSFQNVQRKDSAPCSEHRNVGCGRSSRRQWSSFQLCGQTSHPQHPKKPVSWNFRSLKKNTVKNRQNVLIEFMKSSSWKNLWIAFAIFSPNFPNFKRISQVSTHLFLQRHDLVVFGLEFGGKLFIFNLDFMNCCLNPSQLSGHLLRNEKIIKKKITLLFCKASTMIISKNYFKTKFFQKIEDWNIFHRIFQKKVKNWRIK